MKKPLFAAAMVLGLGLALAATPANTLVIMEDADIPTLDPAQAYDSASYEFIEKLL